MSKTRRAAAGFVTLVLVASTAYLSSSARQNSRAGSESQSSRSSTSSASSSSPGQSIDTEKIVRYVRERFGVDSNIKLTLGPLTDSSLPGFDQAVVTLNDGQNSKTESILVSRDERYLIVGKVQPLGGNVKESIAQQLRDAFKIPVTTAISVGEFRSSLYPDLYATAVTASGAGGKPQTQDFYVSHDERLLVVGGMYNLTLDPRREALRTMITANQPGTGPSTAKVTIVEYADLQCPTCAAFHQFLEKEFLPKYGDRVRVVFKEFPLAMHDWSLTAAVANQCAYRLDPSAFLKYRTLIFANQAQINAANVRDQMLGLGAQAGLDKLQLSACIDSKASLPHVESDRGEAEKLGVARTPTSFINGRMVVGAPPAADFDRMVDEALAGSEARESRR